MAFRDLLQASKKQDNASLGTLDSVFLAKSNTLASLLPIEEGRWTWLDKNEIDAARWNKAYPYQLLMIRKTSGGEGYKIESTFTLPIPPQAMTISTPFAITTTVTLGGIVEEHNGSPIRMISFQGTTGVQPLRGIAPPLSTGERALGQIRGIFAGTVTQGLQALDAVKTLSGTPRVSSNLVADDDEDTNKSTGYYQFRLLQRFLESYVHQKKSAANKELRLAVAIWKDSAVYLVTPQSFDVSRNAQNPWEYNYSLAFKAWKRTSLNGNPAAFEPYKPLPSDPNAFSLALNKLQQARAVLEEAKDTLNGISADVGNIVLRPIREATLFMKSAVGVAATAADLPPSIRKQLKQASLEFRRGRDEIKGGNRGTGDNKDIRDLASDTSKDKTGGGLLDEARKALDGASAANKIFDNSDDNFEVMSSIVPSDLNLPPALQRQIREESERVRKLTRVDFERTRDTLVQVAAAYADSVGAGSEAFNAAFNRGAVVAKREATDQDYEVLFALNQTILEFSRLAASSDLDQTQITSIQAVAGLASQSGIAFTIPTSKFAVPFPYGSTLEQISSQYLGSPDRWHEIVALNGLRAPYVDEVGFTLALLVNGSGSEIIVPVSDKLFIGQTVSLSSRTASRTSRRIINIKKSAGQLTLTLNGAADLESYTVSAGASIHAFLPDTVNSQMLIYIPSSEEVDETEFLTKSIPGLYQFDDLIRVGGVDLLLTQSGDLVVTPDGDQRLAIGLTNLIQRARIAIGTPKGSLIRHPDFGLGIQVGASTADLPVEELKTSLQDLFANDYAFSGVSGISILKSGPTLSVSMSLGIAGVNQTIPISVDIS